MKVGTRVQLRSGGPWMTVVDMGRADGYYVDVAWFEATAVCRDAFAPPELRLHPVDGLSQWLSSLGRWLAEPSFPAHA